MLLVSPQFDEDPAVQQFLGCQISIQTCESRPSLISLRSDCEEGVSRMAGFAVLGVYELAMLAAGAIALMLASPPGQQATREAAKAVADGIDRISKEADGQAKTDAPPVPRVDRPDKTDEKAKECDPCPPPPPPQVHRDHPHFPCQDHWHYFVYNQNPETCDFSCNGSLEGFWSRGRSPQFHGRNKFRFIYQGKCC